MIKNALKIGEKEKKEPSVFSKIESLIKIENFFEDGLPVKYLPKIMFVMALGIFYIGNNHYGEKTVRKIDKVKTQVEDLRADYTTLKANYMLVSRQSEVAKRIAPLDLKENVKPPYKIVMTGK